ncbi:flavin reductase [Bradyrhizobium paxllaeri]|uniref:flavin reductase n=1 Tax=Bradyrhizobium paxllaeri TaxID=190148 RepID=UPI0024C04186|nr:flavin reductase [Bradyrhizobium paxllaeri]
MAAVSRTSHRVCPPARRKRRRPFPTAAWGQGVLNVPVLQSAVCVLECVLHHYQVVGTPGIFVGRIVATRSAQGNPLINFRGEFRTLLYG